jgi:thymidylate synthase
MPDACFAAETLDDALRLVFQEILRKGERVTASRGANLEIAGARVEITDPRSRLSRTETRGKPFSCLGELCWYLAGESSVDFIAYYLKQHYRDYPHEGEVYGAYGPRLFNWRGIKQLANVTSILRTRPSSRQAVIQLFDAADVAEKHEDVPCTCTIQFLVRSDKPHMLVHMRSNDAFIGLPHDVFCFTMLQEIVARDLSVELGTYKHMTGSLHIYESELGEAQQFLNEGWQSSLARMPPMPVGEPWPAIATVLDAERQIRTGGRFEDAKLDGVHAYWTDLIGLLRVFRCNKDSDLEGIRAARARMSSSLFYPFIDRLANSA